MAEKKLILLTNDDGIRSPGLWAAAEALARLGFVTVVAPREQSTGMGRSMPAASEGRLFEESVAVHGKTWTVYAADGTPAQAVQHGLLEILPRRPDLVVSGINYGENVGTGVTISGTVGAALEAASFGIPSLAVSLETAPEYHRSHSNAVDFSAAAHFTLRFAQHFLESPRSPDVDVLKIEVPQTATAQTPWRVTRLSRARYFLPTKPDRQSLGDRGRIGYRRLIEPELVEPDSDVRALLDGVVSVTPLSLDMTSRVDLSALARRLGQ